MEIQLDRFEEQIDEAILQRGLNYFKKGYVTDVEEIGPGDYEATVNGRERKDMSRTWKKSGLVITKPR